MNNDLELFSEERLMKLSETKGFPPLGDVRALARIALAAKQAKPVADDVLRIMQEEWDEWCADTGCFPDDFEWRGGNGTLSFEASRWAARIGARVSNLATPQPSHAEQDGWKLVPIEPTQEMVDAHISGMQSAGFSRAYRDMLAAAPKQESEL